MNKEDNFKEKFKEALVSTVKVISEDYDIKKDKFNSLNSKNYNFFEIGELNSKEDFLTPWLKFILNFFGIDKVETINADQMALNYEKSIKDAEKQIDNIIL